MPDRKQGVGEIGHQRAASVGRARLDRSPARIQEDQARGVPTASDIASDVAEGPRIEGLVAVDEKLGARRGPPVPDKVENVRPDPFARRRDFIGRRVFEQLVLDIETRCREEFLEGAELVVGANAGQDRRGRVDSEDDDDPERPVIVVGHRRGSSANNGVGLVEEQLRRDPALGQQFPRRIRRRSASATPSATSSSMRMDSAGAAAAAAA